MQSEAGAMAEQISGKAPMSHQHPISEVAGLGEILSAIPVLRHAGAILGAPRIFTGSVPTVAGVATFDLTDSEGNSIINSLRYAKAEVSDQSLSYNYAYSVSQDKKTLSVTVYRVDTTTLLGISVLSTAVAAPNGTVVNIFAIAE